jgi:hypothetical protein
MHDVGHPIGADIIVVVDRDDWLWAYGLNLVPPVVGHVHAVTFFQGELKGVKTP